MLTSLLYPLGNIPEKKHPVLKSPAQASQAQGHGFLYQVNPLFVWVESVLGKDPDVGKV